MRLLLVDHFDSYTANILRLIPDDISVDIVQSDAIDTWSNLLGILPAYNGIIVSPGPGHPNDTENALAKRLMVDGPENMPIFGICLGLQVLVAACGGNVKPDFGPRHGLISSICTSAPHPLFANVPAHFDAIRYNSLIAECDSLPSDLQLLATSDDGNGRIVQAIAHRRRPIWAVQFHLESARSQFGREIMQNWLTFVAKANVSPSFGCNHISDANFKHTRKPSALAIPPYRIHSEQLNLKMTPENVMRCLTSDRNSPLAYIFLDTAKSPIRPEDPYRSFISTSQTVLTYNVGGKALTVHSLIAREQQVFKPLQGTLFEELAHMQSSIQKANTSTSTIKVDVGPLGFFAQLDYEMAKENLVSSRASEQPGGSETNARLCWLPWVLAYDHCSRVWSLNAMIATSNAEQHPALPVLSPGDLDKVRSQISDLALDDLRSLGTENTQPIILYPSISKAEYIAKVEQARVQIGLGNSYELCLVNAYRGRLFTKARADYEMLQEHFQQYAALRRRNPAPYSAFLSFAPTIDKAGKRISLLSSSPERLLYVSSMHSNGKTTANMRPIKGTRKRAVPLNSPADLAIADALRSDQKEMAEGLMIADLASAELALIGERGSVFFKAIQRLEGYASVWQLVSEAEATVKPDANIWYVIKQVFPPGSMTGAPKMRSVQILDTLEDGRPRGVYSGSLGYVNVFGDCDLSVVIRTMVMTDDIVTLGAGGAVTWLSDPEQEWEEQLLKAKAVAEIAADFSIFTTAKFDSKSESPVSSWALHYKRLLETSHAFGIDGKLPESAELMDLIKERHLKAGLSPTCRLKISINGRSCAPRIDLFPLPPVLSQPVRLVLANSPVSVDDALWLRHKTSHRAVYDRARAAVGATLSASDAVFDVLMHYNGFVTETSIANIAFQNETGGWITPDSELPFLQGIRRAELLRTGELAEGLISVTSLQLRLDRREIVPCRCFNALRGMYDAVLIR